MRVFIAATSFLAGYGGPAVSVLRLAEALAAKGVDVGLWAADGSASEVERRSPTSRIQLLSGGLAGALGGFGRPDIVHDNGIWLLHNHRIASFSDDLRISRIVSTRGMLEPWALAHKRWKKRLCWGLYQKGDLQRAQCHHVSSERESDNLRRLQLRVPLRVIPNGVDIPEVAQLRLKSGADPRIGERTALFLGRVHPVKGLPMLIQAWARVRPVLWQLQIAGPDEGGHRAELEQAVSAAGLEREVSFLGPVLGKAKTEILSAVDLFILPTHSESFGMAIAESLAHGTPVLTTTAAPWPMLSERGCGWQVDPTVDGLAEGLRRSTSLDMETLRTMGSKGRDMVAAEFGWERIANEFIRLYAEVLRKQPA